MKNFYAPDKEHDWEDLGRAKGRIFSQVMVDKEGTWIYKYYADHWWRFKIPHNESPGEGSE